MHIAIYCSKNNSIIFDDIQMHLVYLLHFALYIFSASSNHPFMIIQTAHSASSLRLSPFHPSYYLRCFCLPY